MDNTQPATAQQLPPPQFTPPAQVTPPPQTPKQEGGSIKKNWLTKILLFAVITILFAGIAFGAMYFFMQSQQKISYAPEFPQLSPMPDSMDKMEKKMEIKATPSAETEEATEEAESSPSSTLTPSPTATDSAT